MSLTLEKQIDWLVKNGFAGELREILLGKSEYSDMRDYNNLDRYSHRLRSMTLQHLYFINKFGIEKVGENIIENGKIYSSYPEYFKAWKVAGAPGVSLYLIEKLYYSKTA